MKHRLLCTLGTIVLGMVAFGASPAGAASAAGLYYATPSWDLKLDASTRFIVLTNWGSAAVLDRETGLVWEQSPSTSAFTWGNGQAAFHCNNLSVGDRKGWKLPTIQELASLVDGDPHNTSSPRLPPGHPFSNVQSSFYWSASTNASFTGHAWGVDFGDGGVLNGYRTSNFFVWCVRGGQGVNPQ